MNVYANHHPDSGSSAFSPSQGWCCGCAAVLRVVGVKWYAEDGTGPYCSSDCAVRRNSEDRARNPFRPAQ